jgi:Mg-chelatase subunit ChlD
MTFSRLVPLVIGCLMAAVSHAAGASQVSIQQVLTEDHPNLVFYVDVLDASGRPVETLSKSQIVVGGPAPIQITDVRPTKDDEGVAYVLLIDVSRSLSPERHQEMLATVRRWIEGLGRGDEMAIVSFGSRVDIRQDFTTNAELLSRSLDGLAATDRSTHLFAAINKALELGRRRDAGLPPRRTIVILSDGENSEQETGLTADDIVRGIAKETVPVFAIDASPRVQASGDYCNATLSRFATVSGGTCGKLGSRPMEEAFASVRAAVRRAHVVHAVCKECPADGQPHNYWIEVTLGSVIPRSEVHAVAIYASTRRQDSEQEVPPPPFYRQPQWVVLWLLLLLAAIVVTVVVMRERRRKAMVPPSVPPPAEPEPVEVPDPPTCGVRLVVVGGLDSGRTYEAPLRDRIVIGRGSGDIQIANDPDVAETECDLTRRNGRIFIKRLNDEAETLVNGTPLPVPRAIEHNDVIRVGRTSLRVQVWGQP